MVSFQNTCISKKHEILSPGPKMAAHFCNPSSLGGRDRRIVVRGKPDKNTRPYLKNKLKQRGLGVWIKW
jgi:hypothetical protein